MLDQNQNTISNAKRELQLENGNSVMYTIGSNPPQFINSQYTSNPNG